MDEETDLERFKELTQCHTTCSGRVRVRSHISLKPAFDFLIILPIPGFRSCPSLLTLLGVDEDPGPMWVAGRNALYSPLSPTGICSQIPWVCVILFWPLTSIWVGSLGWVRWQASTNGFIVFRGLRGLLAARGSLTFASLTAGFRSPLGTSPH